MQKSENNPMRAAFLNAPRCGAKTRKGTACLGPAMPNGRCRMHGGKSTGAPKGNQNALKHGRFSSEAIAQRQYVRELIGESRKLARGILAQPEN
jgi:hypothetical protein